MDNAVERLHNGRSSVNSATRIKNQLLQSVLDQFLELCCSFVASAFQLFFSVHDSAFKFPPPTTFPMDLSKESINHYKLFIPVTAT